MGAVAASVQPDELHGRFEAEGSEVIRGSHVDDVELQLGYSGCRSELVVANVTGEENIKNNKKKIQEQNAIFIS